MVYVDAIFTWPVEGLRGQARRVAERTGGRWCHMWADTLEELHAMAKAIGLQRSWFQDKRRFPHYDLTPRRRAAAVNAGAVETTLAVLRAGRVTSQSSGIRKLILAGCYSQYTNYLRQAGESSRESVYLCQEHQLQGIRGIPVVRYGLWYLNPVASSDALRCYEEGSHDEKAAGG